MDPIKALQIGLGVFVAFYLYTWFHGAQRKLSEGFPGPLDLGIGFVTNFFDTLGIGSYAPTTAMFRAWKLVKDEWIPGTLNVGHTIPTITQAFIFIGGVLVDPVTLVLMISAAFVGAFFGAKVVASWSRHHIRVGMGTALLIGAGLFAAKNLGYIASKGEASGVEGAMLVVAVLGNLMLGALMTIGIGLYAPCMLLVSFIGMNERAAFPIMMGSCAFLMTGATKPFVDKGSYSLKSALGLAAGGFPAVLIAGLWIKDLDLVKLRWLVAAVVLYTGISMLHTAMTDPKEK
ncbi:MAG TPA: sulfite exporter TauE/SafE family protein [Vicinamibacteria bacterium]|nr:sulfite exporter TauE/SafE family protein [Vicinamibacteria bacterium]HRB12167.1 sulfite exporter TauE/SafE family protein [Vicinamibacteria bacterium]